MRKSTLRALSTLNVWAYRWSGGRIMGRFPSGALVLLLSTKGRRSGRVRTVPLLYLTDGEDLIVAASQGGAPTHPGWYLNLQAEPNAEAQIQARRLAVRAKTLSETEKVRFWPQMVAIHPPFAEYQQRTSRNIPMVRLSPR